MTPSLSKDARKWRRGKRGTEGAIAADVDRSTPKLKELHDIVQVTISGRDVRGPFENVRRSRDWKKGCPTLEVTRR